MMALSILCISKETLHDLALLLRACRLQQAVSPTAVLVAGKRARLSAPHWQTAGIARQPVPGTVGLANVLDTVYPPDQAISSITSLPTTLFPGPPEIVLDLHSDLLLCSFVLFCSAVTIFTSSSVSYFLGVGFYLIYSVFDGDIIIYGHAASVLVILAVGAVVTSALQELREGEIFRTCMDGGFAGGFRFSLGV